MPTSRILLVLAMIVLGGCTVEVGSSGASETPEPTESTIPADSSSADAIAEVVQRNLTEVGDPDVECVDTVTPEFAARLYGDVDTCRQRATAGASAEQPAESVEVTDIEVDEETDDATAQVSVTGGDFDGVAGGLALLRLDEGWLIDDFDGAFASSALEQSVRRTLAAQSATADDEACVISVLGPYLRSPDDAKNLFIGLVGGDPAASRILTAAGNLCEPLTPGTTGDAARDAFETGLAAELTALSGLSERQAGCVVGRLRERLDADGVQAWIQARNEDGREPEPVREVIQSAVDLCANVP